MPPQVDATREKTLKARFPEEAIAAFATSLCFLFLVWKFLWSMASLWWNNDTFSHGMLVPFIAVWLFRINVKTRLSCSQGEDSGDPQGGHAGGYLLLLFACALVLAATNSEILFIGGLGIVAGIGAILWIFMGKRFFVVSLPALGMLLFMIPIPPILLDRMTFPMKNLVARATAWLLILLKTPVFLDGTVIHLPNYRLEVADECSGIRSIFALAAFAYAFAAIFVKGTVPKIATFLSIGITSTLANIFRILITALISLYVSRAIAEGFLHEISGIFSFLMAASMTVGVSLLFREKK